MLAYVPLKRYIRSFQKADATEPAKAQTLAELGCHDSEMFRMLLSRRVIVQCDNGKYYLDLQSYNSFVRVERKRIIIIGIVCILLLCFYIIWLVAKYF
jgi:hypothetical protein